MTKAEEIFNVKAYYNKWLKELTHDEKDLVLEMISEAHKDAYNHAIDQILKLMYDHEEEIYIGVFKDIKKLKK